MNLLGNDGKKLPWTEKYRPKRIDDIISHSEIKASLKKFLQTNSLPNLLFSGPSGSGKTSTIKSYAREMYGDHYSCMVMELNASNERGIDVVRSKIKTFSSNNPNLFLPANIQNHVKLVILDETESMTIEAQGLLRQIIEKYNYDTRYCIICNDIDKINPALQSRCAHFRFYPLKPSDMKMRLTEISAKEKVTYCKHSLDAIIEISKGDMRAAINILQHVSLTRSNKIKIDDIYLITGHCLPGLNEKIFKILTNISDKKNSLNKVSTKIYDIVTENNITIFSLLEDLKPHIMNSELDTTQKIYLIENLAKCQIYDSVNIDTYNVILIIVSVFFIANS